MDPKFTAELLDKLFAELASRFHGKGANAEAAVLTRGRPTCEYLGAREQEDDFNNRYVFHVYAITVEVSQRLYDEIAARRETVEKSLWSECYTLAWDYPGVWFPMDEKVRISVSIEVGYDPEWRKKWLPNQGLSNQGRVRSDNVAPYEVDGLLFRSQPEIHLYRALINNYKITFAPLAVFIRGGGDLPVSRKEPDFLIIYKGRVFVVELDGKQFHHETPAEADERLTLLSHEGAYIKHIESAECDTAGKAETIAKQIIGWMERVAANK